MLDVAGVVVVGQALATEGVDDMLLAGACSVEKLEVEAVLRNAVDQRFYLMATGQAPPLFRGPISRPQDSTCRVRQPLHPH